MKVCGNIEIAHRWHHMHAFHTLSIHFGRVCMVQLHAKYRQWSTTLLPWQTWNTTSFQQWKIGHTAACWLCGCHLEVVGPSHCLNHLPYQLKWIIKCYTILPQNGGWKLECQFTNITGFPPTHSANKVPLTGNKVRGHVSWGRGCWDTTVLPHQWILLTYQETQVGRQGCNWRSLSQLYINIYRK